MTSAEQHLTANAQARAERRYGANSGMSGRLVHRFPTTVTPDYLAELVGVRGPASLTVADTNSPDEGTATIQVSLTDTSGTPRVFTIEIREGL